MNRLSSLFAYLLILIHLILVVWGVLGFVEYFYPAVPWIRLQNPTFPKGMQFLHWLAILSGGSTFLIGYLTRWRHTPFAMALVYTMMATLCAVQTLDLMENSGRYVAMVAEYIAYLGISLYLFRSKRMQEHFGETSS